VLCEIVTIRNKIPPNRGKYSLKSK